MLQPTTNRFLATPPLPRLFPKPSLLTKRRRAVGLLGGSFNPAHDGHRQLSMEALKRLALDEIWWLVSPQNPLKPKAGMAPYKERMTWAKRLADHPRIRISDLEQRMSTRFSVDTVRRLIDCYDIEFVFLMGADNLVQLPRWHRWQQLVMTVPIAVFNRTPYSYEAVSGNAARFLAKNHLPAARAEQLKGMRAPVWSFLHMRPHLASSTAIRGDGPNWWQRHDCA